MQHLILDCDTKNEIDDQFAITYALGTGARVDGIVNVQNTHANGPDSVTIYREETRWILEAMDRTDVPNLPGVTRPLERDDRPGRAEGVEFIIERARTMTEEPLVVVGTGPATDLASAVLLAPDIADRVVFYWLGGHRDAETLRRVGEEWNVLGDPWAVKALFESRAPLVHVPAWGVTEKLVWRTNWLLEKLQGLGKPIHRLLADRVSDFMARHAKGIPDPKKEFWDIGAAMCPLHPEWYTIREQPAFGRTEDGTWIIPGRNTRTIRFVEDLDAEAILAGAMSVYETLE